MTIYLKLLDVAKAVPRVEFIIVSAKIKKEEWSPVGSLTLYLKELEKQQTKLNVNRRKEITSIRTKVKNRNNRKN